MAEVKKPRNYGVDLLRLVLMYEICVGHVMLKGNLLTAGKQSHILTYWVLEVAFLWSVDSFGFISGYMAKDRPQKYEKIVKMWFQAFFYSFILTVILLAVGYAKSPGTVEIVKTLFPVCTGNFWYFTSYFALFFLEPVLNRFLFSIDEQTAKKTFIVLFVLFTFTDIVSDPFKLNGGQSALWLMMLYCLGVLGRKIHIFEKTKTSRLLLIWVIDSVITYLGIFPQLGLFGNSSPTMCLNAIIMVVLFSRLKLKGTIISKLSPYAFGVYLFQLNIIIWARLESDCAFISDKSLPVGIACVLGVSLLLWAAGLLVDFLRSLLERLLRIPLLSRKIADGAGHLLDKMTRTKEPVS